MTTGDAPTGSGPTVILVGGQMTLEDGEELDSRQAAVGDRWSSVVHRTMASSRLWWTTAASLVEAILDGAGEGSFALVVGPRVLIELQPDGRLRRTQLRTFFRGHVSKLELGYRWGERKHRSNYQPVCKAPWDEGLQLEVDF